MPIDFADSPEPTLGVEWEFALVDKQSRDLVNAASELFDLVSSRHGLQPRIHKELLRNTVELTTGICRTTDEAMAELADLIELVRPCADELGVDLYSAGTHPFAEWSHQLLTPGHRYEELIARTQWWGRQMLIWGVHVHVGVPRDHVMPIVSSLLKWYPHLQALSASSPIWAGTDTGYASNRAMMFQQLPTAACRSSSTPGPTSRPTPTTCWSPASSRRSTRSAGTCDPPRGSAPSRCGSVTGSRRSTEMRALVALTHCLVVDLSERLDPRRDAARRCRPGTCRRTSGVRRATASTRGSSSTTQSNECLMQDHLRRPPRAPRAGGRTARVRGRPRPHRGDPPARSLLPAPARGRRTHRAATVAVVDSVVREL